MEVPTDHPCQTERGYAHGSGDEPATRYPANAREDVVKVEAELQKISEGILALMDKNPILSESTGEPKVFHYKMKSNFYRYLAECATADTKSQVAEEFVDAPVMFCEQVPMIQKLQKTVEVPRVQHTDKTIDAPVVMKQYIDKIIDVPQEKILERIVDETDVPVSRVTEKIIKVVRQEISVLTETMKEKTDRQGNLSDEVEKLRSQLSDGESILPADKEPASKLDGSCAAQAPEWMELQTLRAEELTAIHVEGVKPIPHERVLSNTVEQIVAVPVPQIREEMWQKIQLNPQDRMSDRIVEQNVNIPILQEIQLEIQLIPQSRISECVSEQTVNIPIQQRLEQTVEVVRAIAQERVDIPGVAQRQCPMVQMSQKTIETPQVQHMDKVAYFPHVQEGQTVQKTVEIPVGISMTAQSRAPAVQDAQKTVKCARVQFLDKIADVPVVVQRQVRMVVQREVSAVPAGQKVVEDVQAQFTDERCTFQLHNTGRSTCCAQSRRQGGTEMRTTCPLRINTSQW